MDGAEPLEGLVAEVLDRLEARDVGDDSGRVDAAGPELVDRLVEGRRLDVGQHDVHPLLSEALAHGPSDAAGAPGDDGDLAVEVPHRYLSPVGDRSS